MCAGRWAEQCSGCRNEGNKGHHYFGIVPRDQDYTEVELRVGAGEKGFQVNLWGNAPDLFSVEVIAPSGEKIPRFVARKLDRQRYDFVFESTILDIQYELSEIVSGDQRLLLAFQNPTPGIWMIRVYAEGNLENTFHMWLPVTGFISDETYFLRPDPDTTVTEPGNAEGVLTFSGYDARNGSIWYDSGRGYTRNGRIKPDLAAPAVEVAASGPAGKSNDPDWKQCGRSFGSRSLCTFAGVGDRSRKCSCHGQYHNTAVSDPRCKSSEYL